ncbi:Blp family class II bacteriocin [Clostridium perfringens]|uniref:Blp family class II bacteriocin n=1 Tax=Clostridium perfringens TaxID=1502 RepID=UPI00224542CC|nr:Blp family class II bacteriocin [Clostridium perfringens]MCX0362217.1 Blp family class II bacteriocin [Clostridium perfringens]
MENLKNEELIEILGGKSAFNCAAGTIGSFLNGGLVGAAGGSVLPGVGTFVGGVLGASAGVVTGAVTFC